MHSFDILGSFDRILQSFANLAQAELQVVSPTFAMSTPDQQVVEERILGGDVNGDSERCDGRQQCGDETLLCHLVAHPRHALEAVDKFLRPTVSARGESC